MALRRGWKIAAGAVAVLAAGVATAVILWDWNWFRARAGGMASEALGREVRLAGDLDVDLGWVTRIDLKDVHIANADWGEADEFARFERLFVSVDVRELLRGRTVLPEVQLVRPVLALERNAEGAANWEFGQNPAAAAAGEAVVPDDRTEFPVIGRLQIEDGRLAYDDRKGGISLDSEIATVLGEGGDGESRVRLQGTGRFSGEPFELRFVGGSLLTLRDDDVSYPLDVRFTVGATTGSLVGTVQEPLRLAGMDAKLELAGPDLARLFPIAGIVLPTTPPYRVAGRLQRQDEAWLFEDFDGVVGESDLGGDLRFVPGEEEGEAKRRAKLTGSVVSQQLRMVDLAGVIGADATEGGSAPDRRPAPDRRVLPDVSLNVERLRAMDADVQFEGRRIRGTSLPIDNLSAHVLLENGRLQLRPLKFGVADGAIAGSLVLDGRQLPVRTEADLQLSRLSLARLLPLGEAGQNIGQVGGRVQLRGRGDDVAEMLGRADGRATLFASGGRLNLLLAELAGVDIAEALGLLATDDKKTAAIRCIVADLPIAAGVVTAETAVFDTTDSNLSLSGTASLRDERLDLRMTAHPKDPSPLAIRTPILIRGPFARPQVLPDPAGLAARAGAAAALGVLLTPLAALIPFLEPGLGEDSDCEGLIAQAKRPPAAR